MRPLPAFFVLAVLGCGGVAPTPEPDPKPVAQAGLPEAFDPRVPSNGSDVNYTTAVDQPPDLVWRALAVAYDSVGIKINFLDANAHLMGNSGLTLKSKLGAARLSDYIDCGRTQGASSADTYDVTMVVISHVRFAESGKTEIATRLTSAARPPTLGQQFSRCTSTTVLERKLAEHVKTILARSGKPNRNGLLP
jgi:hypothetical protein